MPGVARVVEGAFAFAEVGGTRVMLDGFASGTADPLFRALDERVRDDVLAGRGVVLSQNLGKTLGVRVGNKLRLQTPHGPRQTSVLALVPYFSSYPGAYELVNVNSGKCVAVGGARQDYGAWVIQWTCFPSAEFMWRPY